MIKVGVEGERDVEIRAERDESRCESRFACRDVSSWERGN
jgi:hypothetical protein